MNDVKGIFMYIAYIYPLYFIKLQECFKRFYQKFVKLDSIGVSGFLSF